MAISWTKSFINLQNFKSAFTLKNPGKEVMHLTLIILYNLLSDSLGQFYKSMWISNPHNFVLWLFFMNIYLIMWEDINWAGKLKKQNSN